MAALGEGSVGADICSTYDCRGLRPGLDAWGTFVSQTERGVALVQNSRLSHYTEEAMNNLSAICVAACLIPSLAAAQAAPEHHIWQDKGSFEPMSRTAQAITGPIKLSGNPNFATAGSKMTLTFGNEDAVELTAVGASWREWSDADQEKVTAEVYRLDHDPGKLIQGNTLCGDPRKNPARFVVFYEHLFLDQMLLGVDVFQSTNSPQDINSPGLCGTFSFYAPKTGAPATADIQPHSPAEAQMASEPPESSVAMKAEFGTFVVPVQINGVLTLNFTVDSGAADVSIPADIVMTLTRTGTLKSADFLGEQTYRLADGSTVPSQTFVIRSLKVGNQVVQNVTGSVASVKGVPLLGQSFLSRFNSWSIDNRRHILNLN